MTIDSSGPLPPLNRSQRVGSGGFSEIFRDPAHPDRLIKVFNYPLIGSDADRFQRLVDINDWVRPSDIATLTSRFAWPLEWWGDNTGVAGFSMSEAPPGCWFTLRVAGRSGRTLMQVKYLENAEWWERRAVLSEPPDLSPGYRRELAIDWIDAIETLHTNGLAFGDISSNNICANLGESPTVYVFDVDSIGLPAEVESSQVHSPDWVAPGGLDAMRQDRSLAALLVWRLFTEIRGSYPSQLDEHLLASVGATSITRHLETAYVSGDADALSEVVGALRSLRDDEFASAALNRAEQTRFARIIHRDATNRSNDQAVQADFGACEQLAFENAIDEAGSVERKRLVSRSAFAHSGYQLDVRPDTGAYVRPTSVGQLRDLIYDAEFVRLATQLLAQGLGDLESDRWLPRAIQHALVQVHLPEIEIVESPGRATIKWRWPSADYANAAIIDVTSGRQHQSREVVVRDPKEPIGRADIVSESPIVGHVELRLAVKSRSGLVFAGSEQTTTRFNIVRPARVMDRLISTLPAARHNEAPAGQITVQNPVKVAADREKQRLARKRLRHRRMFAAAVSLIAVSGMGLVAFRFVYPLLWPAEHKVSAFASDRDGDWEIYVRRGAVVEQLTNNNHDDRNPTWDPSGKFIAFESMYDGDWELLRMNADGSDVRAWTFNRAADVDMAWN
jgi:hypothetical protein